MAGGDEEGQLGDFFEYMERLRNYERSGVPRGAGTDSDDGFDLGRMRRLLRRLGDPHTHFPAVHIAGTKGKGSTAAFLSNIMREQGYNVGCYSSPHLMTIRERISVGNDGGPVSVGLLSDLFDQAKEAIDESIESENRALTHFEVFTALSFLLFSRENVDIAIIEVVIGGPFSVDIEQIIRDRAFLTQSSVISACDPAIKSITKCIDWDNGKPYQRCDISINISNDMPLSIELRDVNLQLLGDHQRQNAVTASCTALCLRDLGWDISEASIQAGLEETQLPGRSQFLTQEEALVLGLDGASTVLIDGAHTEASAKALSDVIETVRMEGPLALVVGMANDKEYLAFAEQLLSGSRPDVVLLAEASIAGGASRVMQAPLLKEVWMAAAHDLGFNCVDIGTISGAETQEHVANLARLSSSFAGKPTVMIGCQDNAVQFSCDLIRTASWLILESRGGTDRDEASPHGLVCVTGSLHVVASVLQHLRQH
ncbi:Dihydrofolate synthetase [Dichanthelium oligosanthes]|uniref:Dihydrofolate synthetase n=1 Tax=Dichanthelium oligosanthes TaxID=888268 RepID=A0A1E5W4C3_9POAL|nr:Dihydrofolate synthetase [Dichanthelium oligosanthes]